MASLSLLLPTPAFAFKFSTFTNHNIIDFISNKKLRCPEQLSSSISLAWRNRSLLTLVSLKSFLAKGAFEVCFSSFFFFLLLHLLLCVSCLFLFFPYHLSFLLFFSSCFIADIQSAISKINPELLKSVIASGSANQRTPENGYQLDSIKLCSVPSTPKQELTPFRPLPVYSPLQRCLNAFYFSLDLLS